LIDRNGKPYRKIAIQTDQHAGYLSNFIFNQDDPTLQWNKGMEVEIIVYQNGDFWNFKLPTRLDRLEIKVAELEELIKTPNGRMVKEPEEYEDEIKTEDLPF